MRLSKDSEPKVRTLNRESKSCARNPVCFIRTTFFAGNIAAPKMDKRAHNEIRDFYAHMARHFARRFCRYSGNIAMRYFLHNQKSCARNPVCFIRTTFFAGNIAAPKIGKSAHNEIRDFYAHMVLTYERRFVRCFCRYAGNIAQRYFLHNKRGLRSNLCQRLFTKKVQNLTFRY